MIKVPCGGFYIDNETLEVEDGVLKVSGSSLPTVTTDDKNKYLHTNESTGNLEWSAVSGSDNDFLVTFMDEDVGGIMHRTADKTVSEIYAAMEVGLNVRGRYFGSGDTWQSFALSICADGNDGYALFTRLNLYLTTVTLAYFVVLADGSVEDGSVSWSGT